MCLQSVGQIVEDTFERDLFLEAESPGDDLGNLVPLRKELVSSGIARRIDGLVASDQRVDRYDFAVGVQHVQGELTRDVTRQGGNLGVHGSLDHGFVHLSQLVSQRRSSRQIRKLGWMERERRRCARRGTHGRYNSSSGEGNPSSRLTVMVREFQPASRRADMPTGGFRSGLA